MNQIEIMAVECLGCGEEIHPKRLEILPNTKHCVQCSDVGRKRGVTVQRGEGDHSYTDVVIMEEKDYSEYMSSEDKMRRKSTGKSKSEFLHFDVEDLKPRNTKFNDSEE